MLRAAVGVWLGERDDSSKPEVVVDGVERGSATHGDGSMPRRALGKVSFLAQVWRTVDPLGSEHLFSWNRRFLTTAPRLGYLR